MFICLDQTTLIEEIKCLRQYGPDDTGVWDMPEIGQITV